MNTIQKYTCPTYNCSENLWWRKCEQYSKIHMSKLQLQRKFVVEKMWTIFKNTHVQITTTAKICGGENVNSIHKYTCPNYKHSENLCSTM